MNITNLLTFYTINSFSQLVTVDTNAQVANALKYVVEHYFLKQSSSFVFIFSCIPEKRFYFLELMDTLFPRWDSVKKQIIMNDIGDIYNGSTEGFNLMFVDGADSFLNIDPASKVKNYDINEHYFVLLQNRDAFLQADIKKILDYCWANYIINVDILIQRANGELIIYTYFPFTESHCGKVVPVEINRYRNGKMDNEDLFPEKLLNMHRCPLNIALWDLPPFLSIDQKKTGNNAIGGFEGELLKTLSDVMNFEIHSVVLSNNRDSNAPDIVQMLQDKEVDMSMGFSVFSIGMAKILTATDTYYQSRQIFVVLQESPNYITPEMITFPFSTFIWIAIVTTFFLAMGALSWTLTLSRRNLVDVSRITLHNLCLQFFAMTLGMASLLWPRRYFARIFVATWMFGTLVLRAQYQALLYHLIRFNFFERPPSSLNEVVEQDYMFIMNHLTYTALSSVPFFQEVDLKVKALRDLDLGVVFSYMVDHPDEKCVAVEPNEFFLHYGAQNHKAGVYVALPETLLVQSTCIYLTKHSFLINRINHLVRWMSAYGLITSWASKALHLSYFMVPPEPKQSTIGGEQLIMAYYACGILLVLSLVVFVLEMLSLKYIIIKRAFKKLAP